MHDNQEDFKLRCKNLERNCRACCCQMATLLLFVTVSYQSKNLSVTVVHNDKTALVILNGPFRLICTCASAFTLYSICSVCKGWCLCVCSCSPPSAILMTSQLLRGLPRTKFLASTLLPCKHQSQPGGIPHQLASRWPFCLGQNCHLKSYNTGPVLHSYILTPPQVNSILKANEYSFKVCGSIPFYCNNAF